MTVRRWPDWLLVGIALFALTGCNGFARTVQDAIPNWWPFGDTPLGDEAPTRQPSANLVFQIWPVADDEAGFLDERLAAFMAEHAGPPINLVATPDYDRRLLQPAIDEQPADLFLVTGFALPTLIANNLLAPLPGQYALDETIYPTLLPGFAVGATAFCLPRDAHTLALAYNPALFDRARHPYPTTDWTWDDLAIAAEAVTDEDFFLFALTLNPDLSRIAPFLLQAGGDWVDPATGLATFDSPAAHTAMSYFIDLFRSGNAVYDTTLDAIWPGEAFGRGSAGMTIEGSWLLPFLAQDFPRFEYGVAELPHGPAGRATLAFTTCLGVNPNSPHRDRANTLAAYLTRPDIAAEWRNFTGGMPVTPQELAAWQAVNPLRQPFAAGVPYARVWQFPLGKQHIPELAAPIIRSTISGEQDVSTLTQRLQAATQAPN